MAKPDAGFIFIGTYPNEDAARADYDIVKDLHAAGAVGTYDAAVVTKDIAGKVHVNKDETATRHGAGGGAAAGAVVGLLLPPSILVGAAVGGRGRQRDFDCSVVRSGYGVLSCAGVHPDGEAASIACIVREGCRLLVHPAVGGGRLPKRAVPTRTQVLPSSMATAKSFDMPMDSWVTLGKRAADSSLSLRSSRK